MTESIAVQLHDASFTESELHWMLNEK